MGIAIIQRVEMYFDDVFRKTSNPFFKRCGKILISKIVKGNALNSWKLNAYWSTWFVF